MKLTAASQSSASDIRTIGFLGTTSMWVGAWAAMSLKATHWNTQELRIKSSAHQVETPDYSMQHPQFLPYPLFQLLVCSFSLLHSVPQTILSEFSFVFILCQPIQTNADLYYTRDKCHILLFKRILAFHVLGFYLILHKSFMLKDQNNSKDAVVQCKKK